MHIYRCLFAYCALFQRENTFTFNYKFIPCLFQNWNIADMEENSNSEFLAFSSTPIPGANFQPKLGKKNRQNLKRFGQSVSEGGDWSGAHHGGHHPHHKQEGGEGWNRGGGHRARGSRGQRGYSGGGDYTIGGQSQGWGGHNQNSGGHNRSGNKDEGYFHPAMLWDPCN